MCMTSVRMEMREREKMIVRGRVACPTSRLETSISDWKEKR